VLGQTVPAGSRIRLQKDAANSAANYAIDFVNLEQVAPVANPDPAAYAVPAGFGQQDVQNALDRVRMDSTGKLVGVYLPPGDYQTSSKFQVYGKPAKVVGAGPWYTRFHAPASQNNTDVGFRAEAAAKGSTFRDFAYFGNYTSRIDGPGKVFDFANVTDMQIDNIWTEHMVCLYWGANTDRITIKNSRIRNMFADGINMTNGSTDNHVVNNDARATGDDSFALFSAIDAGGADMKNNVYENLTSTLTWRAAGVAVYGGYSNTFRNIHIADTLVYSGVTISSLDFGYAMNGFGTEPTTLENISIVRAGGHFWGNQTFPGIWLFSASKVFQGIRVNNVDIVDPTYSGIMFQTNYVGG
ncbi:Secreted glycosyl hydrolase, partial [Streptomyces albidoflavus]